MHKRITQGMPCQVAGIPGQVLQDRSASGRIMPWAEHKASAQLLAYALSPTDTRAAARMMTCADTLRYRRDEHGQLHLAHAQFCRARLCPICQWRRSLKMYGQLRQVADYLQQSRTAAGKRPYNWLLLTLTVRNCDAGQLGATLDAMSSAWGRMSRRKAWARAIKGTMRAVEITYNRTTQQYHPHMHILCAVLPSYWSSRYYLSQATITDIWHDALRIDYTPIVDVRRASSEPGALAEVAKYTTKPGDYLDASDVDRMQEVVSVLYTVCHGRRFSAWGGVLRDAHHTLHLDDTEDGDLVHIDADAGESDAGATQWIWQWYAGPRLYIGGIHHD